MIFTDINRIRRTAVVRYFERSKGKRALILTAEFPFLVIGRIGDVIGDYLYIDVETTHIDQLEDRTFAVHLDRIETFYIEEDGKKIPKIRQESPHSEKRGEAE